MRNLTAALAGAAVATVLTGGSMVAGAASTPQPYGGCVEAHNYPHSVGADQCRDQGWTIRQRLVVDPHGTWRFTTLPLCREEDGSGQRSACTWNFGHGTEGLYHPGQATGNGRGLTYWIGPKDRTHYGNIHYVWPLPAANPWNNVTRPMADALSEGEHSSDFWFRCRYVNGNGLTTVECPDGTTVTN